MSNSKDMAALLAEARQVLQEAQSAREAVQNALNETLNVRKNIDSEALLAHNAKAACETHSTEIAKLKGTAEAEVNSLTTIKQQASDAAAAITASRAEADRDTKVVSDSRRGVEERLAEVTDAAAKVLVKVAEIEAQRNEITDAKNEAASLLSQATTTHQKAVASATAAEKAEQKANGHLTQITELNESASEVGTTIDESAKNVTALEAEIKQAVIRLKASDAKTQQFEEQLKSYLTQVGDLRAKVEQLLPGATSAGLASAFKEQRQRFEKPQRNWLFIFLICLGGLVAVSAPSFYHAVFGNTVSDWDQLFRGLLARIPVAIPLVWLAIYAGKNYMLSVRIEEDYAFKQTVSQAFEGYKREMTEIGNVPAENSGAVTTLCTNVLTVIGERPGRFYEGKQSSHSISEELQEFADNKANLASLKVAKG